VTTQVSLEGLLNRYSLGGKYLVEPGPNHGELELIIKAALRAPDHGELIPFRFTVIEGESRNKLANLFESYAISTGKSKESCQIERDRALSVPVSIAVIARIDMSHQLVPAHEQWMCIGGAVTNILNAIHMLGYAGKMLSGGKVRCKTIIDAFCLPGESLVGWIVVGTPSRPVNQKIFKSASGCIAYFS
jgi:nitroreductase